MKDDPRGYGLKRTTCSCESCREFCRHKPGMLVPQDLQRIAEFLGEKSIMSFALKFLVVSRGTLVYSTHSKKAFRIQTLVPRMKNNQCIFFFMERCMIHPVSPFGCAFFDDHRPREESDFLVYSALTELMRHAYENRSGDLGYYHLWFALEGMNLVAWLPSVIKEAA